jgi:hypothetical protein
MPTLDIGCDALFTLRAIFMRKLSYWQALAFGSAFFAGLAAIFGKLRVEGLNSNLATLIRTVSSSV